MIVPCSLFHLLRWPVNISCNVLFVSLCSETATSRTILCSGRLPPFRGALQIISPCTLPVSFECATEHLPDHNLLTLTSHAICHAQERSERTQGTSRCRIWRLDLHELLGVICRQSRHLLQCKPHRQALSSCRPLQALSLRHLHPHLTRLPLVRQGDTPHSTLACASGLYEVQS